MLIHPLQGNQRSEQRVVIFSVGRHPLRPFIPISLTNHRIVMPAFIKLRRYSIQTLSSISHLPPLPSFSLDNQESKSKERISTFALRLGRIHYSASGKTLSKSKPPLLLFSVRRRLDVLDTALYRGRMGGWMHEGDLSRLCYRFF